MSARGTLTRREWLAAATALGAFLAWPLRVARATTLDSGNERRDLFPQGVASGDPHPDSVLLWTRRPPVDGSAASMLRAEIATDAAFRRIVSTASVSLLPESDWTCRVLAAGLRPGRVYWYRFTDEHGFASRVGRTITAPPPDADRAVRFSFVSCQNLQMGGFQAYRRMIHDDEGREAAAPDERLDFVLHLGDFIYEMIWYPEDRPRGYYARGLRDIVRLPRGERHADFHIPTTVEDYRAIYRAYLMDPDLQDARARWPFVCVWDNHEFSWRGWQSQQNFGQGVVPAQTRKVAASQAWYEYQPARVARLAQGGGGGGGGGGGVLERFEPPSVADRPLDRFDAHGLGIDPDNVAAIEALTLYRACRWGQHVELVLTDNHSFRSESVTERPEYARFSAAGVPYFDALDPIDTLDGGRLANDGNPPATIRFGDSDLPNPRRDAEPQSVLGARQKAWMLERLRAPRTTWVLWGNSFGMLDPLADLQNLPPDVRGHWPSPGFGLLGGSDWTGYRAERGEILSHALAHGARLVSIAADRHAFQAGTVAARRGGPPVVPEFITGSISAPGLFEAATHNVGKDHPLRALYVYDDPSGEPQPALNLTVTHGVRSSLALQRTHDLAAAAAARNPAVSPHLAFMDWGGHGFGLVHADATAVDVEFIAIPRPVERSESPDGGPVAYRVRHRVRAWSAAESPRVELIRVDGSLPLGAIRPT